MSFWKVSSVERQLLECKEELSRQGDARAEAPSNMSSLSLYLKVLKSNSAFQRETSESLGASFGWE